MLRLTLGPPQQLVDNYNAQLGVTMVTKNENNVNNGLSRSASITSNGDCSMSSGCMSEVDEENAFDVEYPDGGTIRRKPTAVAGNLQPLPALIGDTLPLPPPPQSPGDLTPTDNGHHLPLPPPPLPILEETCREHVHQTSAAIREEIYPCGVMRTRYPGPGVNPEEVAQNEGPPCSEVTQLSLLQQLPSQPPPNLHNLVMHENPTAAAATVGVNGTSSSSSSVPSKNSGRKISFSDYVLNLEESVFEKLKGGSSEEPATASTVSGSAEDPTTYKEQDVSNWVLDSLRHCSNGSTPSPSSSTGGTIANGHPNGHPNGLPNAHPNGNAPTNNIKPKIYNGRTVPNCFSPEEVQHRMQPTAVVATAAVAASASNMEAVGRKFPPPAPPMRSDGTYLTH